MDDPILTISTNDLSPVFALLTLVTTSVLSAFLAWVAYKQARLAKAMKDLHASTNSKMDLLLETVAEASEAKGKLAGIAEAAETARISLGK